MANYEEALALNICIVAEYNPFHNGHLYQINRAKQLSGTNDVNIIAIMSGDFVQRGEPAIANKFTRAKMAIKNGVDLVIELPVIYATASAEYFAYGAVLLMESLKIVDAISFGTESNDINQLMQTAQILTYETDGFKKILKHELKQGCSYPTAREKSLAQIFPDDLGFFSKPNNILAIEYLKALNKLNSKIMPIPVERKGSDYNSIEMNGDICSAAAIRHALRDSQLDMLSRFMPDSTCKLLEQEIAFAGITSLNNYSDIFQYLIKTKSPDELSEILDIGEGLENRLHKAGQCFYELDDIIMAAKTKRYTLARLRRAVLHIILQMRRADVQACYTSKDAGYIRVLGVNKEKSFLLRQIRRQATIPVITQVRKEAADLPPLSYNMLQTELRASDLYRLAYTLKRPFYRNADFYSDVLVLGDDKYTDMR